MSGTGESDQSDNWLLLIVVVIVLGASGAFASLASGAAPAVRQWAQDTHLLTSGDAVVVPVADGLGLDLPRLVLAITLALFVLATLVMALIWHTKRSEAKGRRR